MKHSKHYEAFLAAKTVRDHAYVPYSQFKVGAAVVSETSGAVYAGCNVENASFGAAICAERSAVLQAVAEEGAGRFSQLVVYTESSSTVPPCAMCLQVLSEFCPPEMPVHLYSGDTLAAQYRFDQLLPHPFSKVPGK